MGKRAATSQLERLTFFSDAVFAIAITLLVIEVHVPHLDTRDDGAYLQALAALTPSFMGFALSFLTIGALWMAHHRVFGLLDIHHERLLWPNMLLLMVVAFMPFATALMSANPLARVPELFYAGTLLVAGLLQHWLFRRALAPGLVRPGVPPEDIAALRWRSLGLPTAAAIAWIVAWWLPAWNDFLLLAIPLLVRLYAGLGRRRALRRLAATAPAA
ncbi:TMEM175 family protein [Fulvimonas yonginensis]|uniref:TMEM175 family protein n=1 Tax=Fulvimonas yonginensis TaxID=1495200 RepID=A0ABU8J8A9_9GAMM